MKKFSLTQGPLTGFSSLNHINKESGCFALGWMAVPSTALIMSLIKGTVHLKICSVYSSGLRFGVIGSGNVSFPSN